MAYAVGIWTPSTLKTLLYLKEKNDIGQKLKLQNIPSGTIKNWLYALKQGGYVVDSDGYKLNERGVALLEELKKNPPLDRRGRKRGIRRNHPKLIRKSEEQGTIPEEGMELYEVIVRGKDLAYHSLINEGQANDIVKSISEIKRKKSSNKKGV